MDYNQLTNDEATDILRNHDEVSEDEYDSLSEYIEDPVSVLYWLDADGDFEQAVRIQGLPMDTPIRVARGLSDTDYDFLAHEVVTPEVEKLDCAGCGSELYEFEVAAAGQSWTESFWIDEYGDHMYDEVEFLSDPAAPPYWQADPDGSHIACTTCHRDGIVSHGYGLRGVREDFGEFGIKFFDGESKTLSQESTGGENGTVVRDDWYWFSMDDRSNTWVEPGDILPCDEVEFFRTYTTGDRSDLLELFSEHDYVSVDIDDVVSFSQQPNMPDTVKLPTGKYGTGKYARTMDEIIENWANADEPHPDLKFRFVIDRGSEIFVHEDNADRLRLELLVETLRQRKVNKGFKDARQILERYEFVEAVHNDEYAELELSTGDFLITDREGDGFFNPYVETMGDRFAPEFPTIDINDHDHVGDEIAAAIESELKVVVDHIEWDETNEIYVPHFNKPERQPVTGKR